MYYPAYFVKRCKEVYPAWPKLHTLLEQGSSDVGKLLDDARQFAESPSNSNSTVLFMDEVQISSEVAEAKNQLFNEWLAICDMQQVVQPFVEPKPLASAF